MIQFIYNTDSKRAANAKFGGYKNKEPVCKPKEKADDFFQKKLW